MFALKIISKSTIKKYDLSEQIASEIKIQSILDHPNILKFYYFFTDQTHLYFLLEYAIDGELYKYMKSKK